MTLDEQQSIYDRVEKLTRTADGTAVAIVLLGDRLVGSLDGILSALRAIEDKLDSLNP